MKVIKFVLPRLIVLVLPTAAAAMLCAHKSARAFDDLLDESAILPTIANSEYMLTIRDCDPVSLAAAIVHRMKFESRCLHVHFHSLPCRTLRLSLLPRPVLSPVRVG